jgi:hypothetical protein
MSNSARVFIISETPLLDGNLSRRLVSTPKLEFSGEEMDIDRGIQTVEILKPDIVVWGDSGIRGDRRPPIIQLLTKIPGLKIFHIDLPGNQITLYQSVQQVVKDFSDLKQAIKSDD